MRRRADRQRIERFVRELGRLTRERTTLYLSGGASAVLYGWRPSTIDIDVRLEPERDELLRTIADLKERLAVAAMLAQGLVEPSEAMRLFDAIESELYRFPAIEAPSFRKHVEEALGGR